MAPAAKAMADALTHVHMNAPVVPLVANVLAHDVDDSGLIRTLLVEQMTHRVRWRESVAWMVAHGVTEFWEIGAGKALSGMIRRTAPEATTRAISTAEDVKAAVST